MNAPMNTDLATLSPDWLGAYVAGILSTDFGRGSWDASGDLCLVETDVNDEPMSFLAAAPHGLAIGEWNGAEYVEVEFVPWREVRGVSISDSDLEVTMRNGDAFTIDMTSLPCLVDEDDDDVANTKAEAHTRTAAARLIALLSDSEAKS